MLLILFNTTTRRVAGTTYDRDDMQTTPQHRLSDNSILSRAATSPARNHPYDQRQPDQNKKSPSADTRG
jgi:hypothetical protein